MNDDPRPSASLARRPAKPSPASPLDPFLAELLTWIATANDGFALTAGAAAAAEQFSWQPAFVDALLTGARMRGFLEPFRGRGARGRTRWQLSKRGAAWIAARAAGEAQDETAV